MEPKLAVPDDLKALLNGGETVDAFAPLDLRPDGSFGQSWLVLTPDSVRLVGDGSSARTWELASLKEAKIRNLTGNGFVLLTDSQGAHEAARFSQVSAEQIEVLIHKISARISMDKGNGKAEPKPKKPCPKCGLAIPPGRQVCPVCFEKKKLFKLLIGLIGPFKAIAIFSVVLSAVHAALDLVSPWLYRILVDEILIPYAGGGAPPEVIRKFLTVVGTLLGIHLVNSAIGGWRNFLMGGVGEKIVLELRKRIYVHLQKLSLGYYHRKQTGWIISRVTNDTDRIQGFLMDGLPEMLIDVLLIVFILTWMFSTHWQLALGVIVPGPIAFFGIMRFGRKMERIYHRAWRRFSLINSLLGDVIPGVKVTKIFAQEDKEKKRFDHRVEDAYDHNMKAVRVSSVFYPAIWAIFGFGHLSVWGWGGWLLLHGDSYVTVGMLIQFNHLMWRFYDPIHRLSRITNSFQKAMTSAERVFEMLEERPEVAQPAHPKPLPKMEGRVTFENVHFRYKEGEPVLKGIKLDVKPGEMIGLVGTSGAGKTTLVGLIPRFYDATEGRVLIDGVDVRDLSLQELRAQMGMVLQDPFLFHGSIRDNIAYADPQAGEEDLLRASEAGNAHGFIRRFPEGYDSQVGERGVLISGGEKQRISIARAILHNPKILILDEATSSVDTETERQIQEAIFRLVKNRTTFVIAHRLSTLRRCDRILVVDKGRIAEIGTHEELIARKKKYFRLCNMQAEMSRIKAL